VAPDFLEEEMPFQDLKALVAACPLKARGKQPEGLSLVFDRLLWNQHHPFQIAAADKLNSS